MAQNGKEEENLSPLELERLLEGLPKRVLHDGDMIILDDMSRAPHLSFPISTDYAVVTFCLEGSAQGRVNMTPIRIVKGDVFVLVQQQMVSFKDASPDFKRISILISPRCQSQMRVLNPLKMQLSLLQSPVMIPKQDGLHFITLCMQMLREALLLHDDDIVFEMVKKILDILSLHMLDGKNFTNGRQHDRSRMEHFFECFVDELMKHYATSHSVAWYADQLSITANYLSKCCRKAVSISALDVVNNFLILEAQRQLQIQPPLPLKVVAYNLGFSNQSSFSTFFSRMTKQSPAAYRNL